MSLWLIDSLPEDLAPELFVYFDDEPEFEAPDGICYNADSEGGPTLFIDPAAMCSDAEHFEAMPPFERYSHFMYRIFGRIQSMQIHTVLLFYDELMELLGLASEPTAQPYMIREFRSLMERFEISGLYLFTERRSVRDAYLDDLKDKLGIASFQWRDEEQALPMDKTAAYRCLREEYRPQADEYDPSHGKPVIWKTDISFGIELDRLIRQKNILPGEFVKRANISRQTMNNLRKPDYTPQKYTVLACVVALELSLSEANRLLSFAGYTLSSSLKADVIISFYISKGIFDIDRINLELFHANQHQLGSRS